MLQTENEIEASIEQLARSDKGQDSLRRILEWMNASGLSLDWRNKEAAASVIAGCWAAPGTVRDLIAAKLD